MYDLSRAVIILDKQVCLVAVNGNHELKRIKIYNFMYLSVFVFGHKFAELVGYIGLYNKIIIILIYGYSMTRMTFDCFVAYKSIQPS